MSGLFCRRKARMTAVLDTTMTVANTKFEEFKMDGIIKARIFQSALGKRTKKKKQNNVVVVVGRDFSNEMNVKREKRWMKME